MGGAISTDQTGAVDRETHGQTLQRHIMHHLIIAALQEGRIDRAEGPQPAGRHACGKSHAMLFGNTHIEHARGKAFGHDIKASAIRHRRRHRDHTRITRGDIGQRLPEDRGIAGRIRLGFDLRAGRHVEFRHTVILVA